MRKIKNWFIRYKEELLFGWSIVATVVMLLFLATTILFMGISEDLVSRVDMEVTEKEEIKMERDKYYYLLDDLKQTYEDVVPKGQYIQDVEYLESVIRELREQLETYNN